MILLFDQDTGFVYNAENEKIGSFTTDGQSNISVTFDEVEIKGFE